MNCWNQYGEKVEQRAKQMSRGLATMVEQTAIQMAVGEDLSPSTVPRKSTTPNTLMLPHGCRR
jgi:hypothetical protein